MVLFWWFQGQICFTTLQSKRLFIENHAWSSSTYSNLFCISTKTSTFYQRMAIIRLTLHGYVLFYREGKCVEFSSLCSVRCWKLIYMVRFSFIIFRATYLHIVMWMTRSTFLWCKWYKIKKIDSLYVISNKYNESTIQRIIWIYNIR